VGPVLHSGDPKGVALRPRGNPGATLLRGSVIYTCRRCSIDHEGRLRL
jgi:hypothetical protein